MCIGKRFAELELQMVLCKVLQKYRVEWAGDDEPIKAKWALVNRPHKELKFRFVTRN